MNFGSLAEKAGLQVGDALVRVNGQDVYDVKHKDAQDVILGAGNAFELTIQRYCERYLFYARTHIYIHTFNYLSSPVFSSKSFGRFPLGKINLYGYK